MDRSTQWAIALFFVALFIPGSMQIGVRMTPYRLYLIVMAIPMILRFRTDPTMRITPVDVLMFLATFWRALAILVNHGTAEIANAGASFMELFFGYLLGRTYLRSAADYRFFFRCFLITLAAFLPFALVELVLRRELLRDLFGVVLIQPPLDFRGQIRWGMMRVQLSFDHALLFGTFCTMGFANVYYVYRDRFPMNLAYAAFVSFMTLLAMSSSSILVLGVQGALMVYAAMFRFLPYRWVVLVLAGLIGWFGFELIFSMTPVEFVVQVLIYNPTGAEGRIDQVIYGLKEIQRHPIFGIGLNEAALPFWRGDVFDNFWLFTAVRYGLPGLTFMLLAFVAHFLSIGAASGLGEVETRDRLGYMIAFATTGVIIGTLTIWGIGLVFVMVFIGAGVWFYDSKPSYAGLRRHERASARARDLGRPVR